jgi:fluoride ion exporter CrcB/FEX
MAHGSAGRIVDISDLPWGDQDAVNILGVLTWNAIALMANKAGDPKWEALLIFGVAGALSAASSSPTRTPTLATQAIPIIQNRRFPDD